MDPLYNEYPSWSPYTYTLNNPIIYTDPTGEFVGTLIGAVVGAITAYVMDENVLRGAAVGAMTGAMADLTVLTGGTALAVAGGLALSGAAGYTANQAIDNLPVDPFDLAVSALMGAVGARNLPQGSITVGRMVSTNATLASNAAKEVTAPKGWITQASKKGGGTVFKDPSNPHNIIRQMPGNPNSPNVLQQNPYVKFMKNGKFYDVNGNILPNGNVPGAHIPLDQFNINNMPKF
jgi:hypothetical protein